MERFTKLVGCRRKDLGPVWMNGELKQSNVKHQIKYSHWCDSMSLIKNGLYLGQSTEIAW